MVQPTTSRSTTHVVVSSSPSLWNLTALTRIFVVGWLSISALHFTTKYLHDPQFEVLRPGASYSDILALRDSDWHTANNNNQNNDNSNHKEEETNQPGSLSTKESTNANDNIQTEVPAVLVRDESSSTVKDDTKDDAKDEPIANQNDNNKNVSSTVPTGNNTGQSNAKNTELQQDTVQKSSSTSNSNLSSSCRFEDGNGYYQTVNGKLSWDWIHNVSIVPPGVLQKKNCTIVNHLKALSSNEYNLTRPLVLLTLGDSLDRNIVDQSIFGRWGQPNALKMGFDYLPYKLPKEPGDEVMINTARKDNATSVTVFTNGIVSFAFFKIYGMYHSCTNEGRMVREDNRPANTTAERINRYLDFDVLSRVPKESNYVVMVSSALWDLSEGCNHQVGLSDEYRKLYREGIFALHEAIQKLLPNAPIYWKTSPYMSVEYDDMITKAGTGRTRANQVALNDIIHETVTQHNLGVVLDWWAQANQRPEAERGINGMPDGRHYQAAPSIAFYNMFLNAVFDHHPEFLT